MCFATTSQDAALDWACRRGIRHGGDVLFVYEVQLEHPQVDVNMHGAGSLEAITSVMSPTGIVVGLAKELATTDCRNPLGKAFCPCPRSDR